jgi:hypothetical protein
MKLFRNRVFATDQLQPDALHSKDKNSLDNDLIAGCKSVQKDSSRS